MQNCTKGQRAHPHYFNVVFHRRNNLNYFTNELLVFDKSLHRRSLDIMNPFNSLMNFNYRLWYDSSN